jgi:hypothetical protein
MPGFSGVAVVPVASDEVQGLHDGPPNGHVRPGLAPDLRDRYEIPRGATGVSAMLTAAYLNEAGAGWETAFRLVRRN